MAIEGSPHFYAYLRMSKELDEIRKRHDGAESQEEDELLEAMDDVWYRLTKEEIQKVEERLR